MSSSPDSGLGACSPSNSQIESHGPPQMGQADQQITPSSTGAYALSMQAWHLDAFKAAKRKLAAAAEADGPLIFDKLKLESAADTPV